MSHYLNELPENAVQVKGAMNWVTPDGKLFGIETRVIPNKLNSKKSKHKHYGEYFQYQTTVNKHNGYVYAPIKYIKENGEFDIKQRRLHIVVAETLIPNPYNLPIGQLFLKIRKKLLMMVC